MTTQRTPRATAAAALLRDRSASATVELALGILSLTVVLGVLLGALALGAARLSAHDAARVAVRAAARGEDPAHVIALATAARPGAEVDIHHEGDRVSVTITSALPASVTSLASPALSARLPLLRATATAQVERAYR
ncbi:MAG: pilus assembly protein TadE [Actinomycetales bacterium]|nr:pilus assembly protein TadE [Actinomycetales bacterium]